MEDFERARKTIARIMPVWLQGVYSPEDFVSDAVVSVLASPCVEYRGSLTLTMAAKRRMIEAIRRHKKVERLSDDAASKPYSPDESAMAHELRQKMIAWGRTAETREWIARKCDGYTIPEIARSTGSNLRKVQRILKRMISDVSLI